MIYGILSGRRKMEGTLPEKGNLKPRGSPPSLKVIPGEVEQGNSSLNSRWEKKRFPPLAHSRVPKEGTSRVRE